MERLQQALHRIVQFQLLRGEPGQIGVPLDRLALHELLFSLDAARRRQCFLDFQGG
ncbi:hypothetical protein D3C79_701510 [compost metagenome]